MNDAPFDQTEAIGEPHRLGRRRFIAAAGATAGAAALTSLMPARVAEAAVPVGASSFEPLAKGVRLADTREPFSAFPLSTRVNPTQIRVQIAGHSGVPANASAAVLTVTAVNGGSPNFVTVFPTGITRPEASNLNLVEPGAVNANLATVKLGTNGSIEVFSLQAAALIVDVLGYYVPTDRAVRAGRFVGLSTARRAIDTRLGSQFPGGYAPTFLEVDVTKYVPADASSIVINLTATETTGPSFFTALPSSAPGSRPTTSSLNVTRAGDTRAAGVIVPVPTVGGKRMIKVFSLRPAKIIVDITGYFTSDDSASSQVGLFVPANPVRLIDTRNPGTIGRLWPGWVVEAQLPAFAASNASAAIVNVTGVLTRGPGFLTVSAARQPIPGTSNVNFTGPAQVVPNHVITAVTATHGLQIYSSHGAHVLADFAGYYTGPPMVPTLAKYVNPAPPAAPPEWIIRIPRLGLTSRVLTGDPGTVTGSGHSWHWTGTGFLGHEGAHVAIFGHRTEAGGPYRNLDRMVPGDLFTLTTGDNREFTYRMVRRDLTDSANTNILNAVRAHPGTTMSLVACTVGHDRTKSRWPDVWAPTSLRYRIVVTAELVSWREF